MIIFFLCITATGRFFAQENAGNTLNADIIEKKSFGSFVLPEGWIEAKQLSRGGKYFYVPKGVSLNRPTTNISLELGTNPYSISQHTTFRYAILQQLLMQAGNKQVSASGGFTDNDYPLYIFTIEDENSNPKIKTVQYYIIGEKKHILILLTDFYDNKVVNAEEIALAIAFSFTWEE